MAAFYKTTIKISNMQKQKQSGPSGKAPSTYRRAHIKPSQAAGSQSIQPDLLKKIHPKFLPVIGHNSENSIIQIRDALITYCQREIGPISKMFTAGKFDPPPHIVFDSKDFSAASDPSGILKAKILNQMKTRDSELESYDRSKLRLFGIISSMVSKEIGEKIRSFFTDKANAAITTAASAGLGASTATAAISATDPSDNECPLEL